MSRFKVLIALLAMLCFPHFAKAACTFDNTTDGLEPQYIFTPQTLPPSFNPNNYAVGAVIFQVTIVSTAARNAPPAGGAIDFYCPQYPTGSSVMTVTSKGVAGNVLSSDVATSVGGISTYPSNIPGIGVRLNNVDCSPTTYFPYTSTLNNPSKWNAGCTRQLTVVKTGPITQGGTLSGLFGGSYVDDGSPLRTFWMGTPIPILPQNPTCALTAPNPIQVAMGSTPASSFSGVGTTASGLPAASFNLTLNCGTGSAGTQTAIYVTLTDRNNPGNTTDILPLDPSSTASGVGVRIFNGATALKFGPDSATVGNTNQWQAATVQATGGPVVIPLTAKFVQTAPTITPGAAVAYATFTMAYQ